MSGAITPLPGVSVGVAVGLAALALLGCGSRESGASPPPPDAPSLLLVSLDSVRADHLSCAGYRSRHAPGEPTTPRLDALAAQGVRFTEARASSSWTLPSHVALLTGRPDLVHGVDLDEHRIGAGTPTLAERLAAAGYRTAGFYSGPYLEPRFGFDRGFERYRACYGPELERASAAFDAAHAARLDAPPDDTAAWEREAAASRALEVASQSDHSAATVADAVIAELHDAAAAGAPFFLFAHFFDPHYDYAPPEPYARRFDPDYAGALDASEFIRNPAIATFDAASPSGRRRVLSERDLEHVLALYDGELAATDAEVGRVLDALDELGLTEHTVVAVVADHGDEFFEHGGIGHRRTLDPEVLHVPLLVRYPAGLSAGRVVREPVATYDLAPALLELLGVAAPDLLRGGLAPLLRGEPGDTTPLLSRLVLRRPGGVTVDQGGRAVKVAVDWIDVLESCRLGALDVRRAASWYVPTQALPAELAATLREDAARRRSEESLRWIDVAEHPGEPDDAFRTDFTDARAAAALGAFGRRVSRLTGERILRLERADDEARGTETPAQAIALGALGYSSGAEDAPLSGDALVLPPPTAPKPAASEGDRAPEAAGDGDRL